MKKHYCHVVCVDKVLNVDGVINLMNSRNSGQLYDGVKAANTIQGKHLKGENDDRALLKCLENGWRIPYKHVNAALTK